MRQHFRQYFIFSENERRAVIALTSLALFLFLLPYVLKRFKKETTSFDNALQTRIEAFTQSYGKKETKITTDKKYSLFAFDPNKIGVAEWQQLGLSEKQATVIENYKAKGGQFRKAEDIRKIFVLSDEKKEELLPYVNIENSNNYQTRFTQQPATKSERPKVDINTADSALFESLPMIGGKRAASMVKYREWLGGYYNIAQVSEIYSLPDSIYQIIKPRLIISEIPLRKININTADYETFRGHPYTRRIAGYIIKYRNNNAGFKSADQICRVPEMTDSICQKLLPYIAIE